MSNRVELARKRVAELVASGMGYIEALNLAAEQYRVHPNEIELAWLQQSSKRWRN